MNRKIYLYILPFLLLTYFSTHGQMVDIQLSGQKDCGFESYCVDILLSANSDTNPEIGNASIMLEYNAKALTFESYTPANFHAGSICTGTQPNAWDVHQTDAFSKPGNFHIVLLFEDGGGSCQSIGSETPTAVGTVCFDIRQQGGNPEITIAGEQTYFNSNNPNNGNNQVLVNSSSAISDGGLLACDCDGEGQVCDDNNVYTVNDQYDVNCECHGEELDTDQDGILDGIDACLDQAYQAEDAVVTNAIFRNNFAQYSGTGFIDCQTNNADIIKFSVYTEQEGSHQISFRYALKNSARWMRLYIDGQIIVNQLSFPTTTQWYLWQEVSLEQFLTAGDHNIELRTEGSQGPNIDKLVLSYCTACDLAGQACDDGIACTEDDVYDADCNCNGRYVDSDQDGVCDAYDTCPGSPDDFDEDGDGLPDDCDTCNDLLIGQACDDGAPCTFGDIYDAFCNCVGLQSGNDSDNDGVCDDYDICPGGDDYADEDGDGIPNNCDTCNDLTIGRPCDDGNPCTILDVIQADCGCSGFLMDNDGDGVCNWEDICEGADDNIDIDEDGIPDGCDPNVGGTATIRIETGIVPRVGESWQTIQLENTYQSMVVIATPHIPSSAYSPVVTRIRNANGNSFDVKIQVPGGSTTNEYPVYFIVAEEGIYQEEFDGINMEVKKLSSSYTSDDSNWWDSRQSVAYDNSYNQPVVLGQVMSYNDPLWSVFYASGSSSGAIPDNTELRLSKHVGEDSNVERANEMLGYMVIEAGQYEIGDIPFEAGVTTNSIGGLSTLGSTYDIAMSNANGVIYSIAGMNGGNGGWPVLYGRTPILNGTLSLIFDEDQILDEERAHTTEEVAYLAFYEADNCQLEIITSVEDVNCFNGDDGAAFAEFTSAVGFPIYQWSNSINDAANEGITAGTYTVSVTDANGCVVVEQINIGQPTALTASATIINNICYGGLEGEIALSIDGGVEPYAVQWSNDETTETILALGAGTYDVTLTDANDCIEVLSELTISEADDFTITVERTPADPDNGSLSVSASGGTPPYIYSWSNGSFGASLNSLSANVYGLTVTDAIGCEYIDDIEVYNVPKLLSGVVEATESWQTINLSESFDNMVVVATVQMPNGSSEAEPAVVRINNVGSNAFDLRIQNPGGTTNKTYTVHYLVTEEGIYQEETHGITMEAVFMQSTKTAHTANWQIEERTYQNTYNSPIVFGQVMSYNDSQWSSFWASTHDSRTEEPTPTRLGAGKHVGGASDNARADEKLGVIIIEEGTYNFSDLSIDVSLSADNISGVSNTSTGYPVSVNLPTIHQAILCTAGFDGGDGGWPVLYGPEVFTPNTISVAFDEDQVADSERAHTTEVVAYLAIQRNDLPEYCVPNPSNTDSEWIHALALPGMVNVSNNDGGYGDYSDMTAIMTRGTSVTFQGVPGFGAAAYPEYWKVYIDYNQDLDFDDFGEEVLVLGPHNSFVTGSFTIPMDATLGATRMRVVMSYTDAIDPCGLLAGGEVEDYTVVIQASSGLAAPIVNNLQQIATSEAQFSIHPNPVSQLLNVDVQMPSEQISQIQVVTLSGQVIYTEERQLDTFDQFEIAVENWANGVYIIQIKTAQQTLSKRFVKTSISR